MSTVWGWSLFACINYDAAGCFIIRYTWREPSLAICKGWNASKIAAYFLKAWRIPKTIIVLEAFHHSQGCTKFELNAVTTIKGATIPLYTFQSAWCSRKGATTFHTSRIRKRGYAAWKKIAANWIVRGSSEVWAVFQFTIRSSPKALISIYIDDTSCDLCKGRALTDGMAANIAPCKGAGVISRGTLIMICGSDNGRAIYILASRVINTLGISITVRLRTQ